MLLISNCCAVDGLLFLDAAEFQLLLVADSLVF